MKTQLTAAAEKFTAIFSSLKPKSFRNAAELKSAVLASKQRDRKIEEQAAELEAEEKQLRAAAAAGDTRAAATLAEVDRMIAATKAIRPTPLKLAAPLPRTLAPIQTPATLAAAPAVKSAAVAVTADLRDVVDRLACAVHADFSCAPAALKQLRAAADRTNTSRAPAGVAALVRSIQFHAAQAEQSTASHAHLRAVNAVIASRTSNCGAPSAPADPSGILAAYRDKVGTDGLDFFKAHRAEIEQARSGVIADVGEFKSLQGTERASASFKAQFSKSK